ncbi:MAG: hypothetical protein GX490_01095 [Bacilli bacterium]|nr:hypothetical protein [Bacilli bacterium]
MVKKFRLSFVLLFLLTLIILVACQKPTYTITVNGGTGSGTYVKNEEVTITAEVPEGKIFVRWEVDGKEFSTQNPYTFKVTKDLVINAVFEDDPNVFTATFMADGKVVNQIKFRKGDTSIPEPLVPNKAGYIGEWEDYTLSDSDITINAVYRLIEYTATFKADGKVVDEVKFTIETEELEEPEVPEKPGYVGKWEPYTLGTQNITINAIYTLEGYSHVSGNFKFDNGKFISDSSNAMIISTEDTFTSGTYTVTMKAPSASDNGVVFGVTDNGKTSFWEDGVSYYFFFISKDGTAYLGKVDNGWSAPQVVPIPNYNVNNTYEIKVAWDGTKIRGYINDEMLISYVDPNPLSGDKIGLRAQVSGVEYTDLIVSDELPDDPDAPANYNNVNGAFEENEGVLVSKTGNAFAVHKEKTFTTGSFTAYLKANERGDNGVVFGLTDNGLTSYWENGVSYYVFMINVNGTILFAKVDNNTWTTLKHAPDLESGYDPTKTFKLTIVWDGTTVKGYVDDVLYITYTDNNPLTGNKIGVRAQKPNVEFSDITVTSEMPEEPESPEGYDIVNGNFRAQDGKIISSSSYAFAVNKTETLTLGTYTVFMKAPVTSDNGIVFGLTDNDLNSYWEQGVSYYFFFISKDGTAYLAKVNNGWNMLKVVTIPNYNVNNTYKISISWDGEKIWCYVDDVLYITYTDASPLTGTKVGLRAQVANVEYSNIEITEDLPEKEEGPEGYKVVSGVFEETEGVLVSKAVHSLTVKEEQVFTSGRLTVSLKANIKSDNGIVFGLLDDDKVEYWEQGVKYYFFFININGTIILAKVDNGWQTLAEKPDLEEIYNQTQTYNLTVEWDGFTIKCYVDDVLYITYEDANPLAGTKVGLRAQIAGVEFSNLTIEQEQVEEPTYEYQVIKGNFDITEESITASVDGSLAVIKDVTFTNGTFTINFKPTVASDSGIIFGLSDDDQTDYWEDKGVKYYFFFLTSWNGAYLAKVDNGWTELKSLALPGFNVNNTYKLSVVWDGATIKCYVDDVLVISYTDSTPLTGTKIGLRAQKASVKYSNVRISNQLPREVEAPANYDVTSGLFEEANGKLVSRALSSFAVARNQTFSEGKLSVNLKAGVKSDNGLVFGLTDNGLTSYWEQGVSYYYFFINLNGTMILAKVDDGWNTLSYKADLEAGYNPNSTYKIAIEWDGFTIKCYVDDVLYITYEDDNPLTGKKFGVRAQAGNVEFSNLSVEEPSITYEYKPIKGTFKVGEGLVTSQTNDSIILLKDIDFINGTYTVNLKADTTGDNGIIFGLSDDDQTDYWEDKGVKYYYFFVAVWGGAYLAKVDNGWKELMSLPIPGYNVNNTYKLSVVWDGSLIRCYINDELFIYFNDQNPLTGTKVGFRAQKPNVQYSKVRISDDVPEVPVAPEEYNIVSGYYTTEDGKLISASGRSFAVLKNETFASGTFSANLKAGVKSDNGLVFGLTDNSLTSYWEQGVSYYFFFINVSGTMILAKVNNGWNNLTDKPNLEANYDSTRTYKLTVEWDGSTIKCYVDDVLYITYTDENPLTGNKVAVRAQVPGVEFTDVEITEVEEQ